MTKVDTVVIGGGIVGLSCAYYCARRGQKVVLIERDTLESGVSTGNAGLVAFGHTPMPRPGVIKQTMRMLFDPINPLYVKPRFDLAMFKWFLDFRKACTQDRFNKCMKILTDLGWGAKECFEQIINEEMVNGEYRSVGWLDLCLTEERLKQSHAEAELMRSYGYNVESLAGDGLRRHDPAVRDEVIGGAHYHDSAIVDPGRFVSELGRCLPERGVIVRTKTDIKRILTKDDRFVAVRTTGAERIEANNLVLAAGIWTSQLAKTININIPMQAGKGYHVNLTAPKPMLTHGVVCAETFVAATPMAGTLRLAGTIEFSGINDYVVQKRLNMLQIGARKYIRGIGTSQSLSFWSGLRPCIADGLPAVGPTAQVKGVYFATGHAMMGFTLGPVTGRIISECIVDGKTETDITLLSPDRFSRAGRG